METNGAKEITWSGDPIANWSIEMREAREDEDVQRVEQLLNGKIQPGPSVPQMEGLCFSSFPATSDRPEVQIAMVDTIIELAKFHGFNDFDESAVNHLSSGMANFMEGLCNQIRINRCRVYMNMKCCNWLHAAVVTLLRPWLMSRNPKIGLRGLLQWYNETYRMPAIRADISARKWVEWTKLPQEERGEFVESEIVVDEEEEEERVNMDGEEGGEYLDKEEDYMEMLSLEEFKDRVPQYYEKEEKEEEKKKKGEDDEAMDGEKDKPLVDHGDIPLVDNEDDFESENDDEDEEEDEEEEEDENSAVDYMDPHQYIRYLAAHIMEQLYDIRDQEEEIRGRGLLLQIEQQQLEELNQQRIRLGAVMEQHMEEHPQLQQALQEMHDRAMGGNVVEEEGDLSEGSEEEGEEVEDVDMSDAENQHVPDAQFFEEFDDRVIEPAEYIDVSDEVETETGNDEGNGAPFP